MTQARTSLTPADENEPTMTVFTATKPDTQAKLSADLADAAKQRPHRQFLVVHGGRSVKLPDEAVAQLSLALVQFQPRKRPVTAVIRGRSGPEIDRVLHASTATASSSRFPPGWAGLRGRLPNGGLRIRRGPGAGDDRRRDAGRRGSA
jgi:hypothetical protein